MNPHFLLLDKARAELSLLEIPFVFIGGATVSLHVDDPAGGPVRVTKDVDLVVEVTGYADYAQIEDKLRQLGFEQDLHTDGGPICRWMKQDLIIDVLPTDPEILGFGESDWFRRGFEAARTFHLPTGATIRAFGPLYLLAAKIEAFNDRGDDDWLLSQDIEDVATLLDGRLAIFDELEADDDVACFVRRWLKRNAPNLLDPIADKTNDYARARFLVDRLGNLSD